MMSPAQRVLRWLYTSLARVLQVRISWDGAFCVQAVHAGGPA